MSFKATSRDVGDVTVIDMDGRVTLGEGSSLLRDLIQENLNKGRRKILLNLAGIVYIDSTGLGALVMPITVLIVTAVAVSLHAGRIGPANAGPHGFTEILYALTSQGNNNGSAFGGLTGNTAFYNVVGGIDMLLGRFAIMIPALALGGSLAAKGVVPESLGTFRTDNSMFIGLTIGVIIIIGGLTFFPAVSLGPIVEQLSHGKFF